MSGKIKVLDIDINDYTAKQAMKQTMQYMQTEVLSVVELVTADTLMYAKEEVSLKDNLRKCNLVLPGEKEILEAANIIERKRLQEVETKTYLKLFLHYLHKNHLRAYLLVEEKKEAEELCGFLKKSYKGIEITGVAELEAAGATDDMIINQINGSEADCILVSVSSPVHERFVIKNKNLINSRVWLGAGKLLTSLYKEEKGKGKFLKFIIHRIFKREIEKKRKEI